MPRVAADYPFHGHYTSLAGPGVPTGVTVQALSCHTLKVTWSSPEHTGGLPITGYTIAYTDEVTTTVERSAAEEMALIRLLSPGTAYKLEVLAVNVIGQGQEVETTPRTKHRGMDLRHSIIPNYNPYVYTIINTITVLLHYSLLFNILQEYIAMTQYTVTLIVSTFHCIIYMYHR